MGSTTYTYQWHSGGAAIPGATSDTYRCITGNEGGDLSCTVTATNGAGSVSVSTLATSAVAAAGWPAVATEQRRFAVVGATTLLAMQACGSAGVDEVVIQAEWSALQPAGAGTALSASAVSALQDQFASAAAAHLDVIFEIAFHYTPGWVVAAVEAFTDQTGNTWTGSAAAGDQTANWMWTAVGRRYAADLMGRITAALGSSRMAQITDVRIGGGNFGEAHYPDRPANTGGATPPSVSFYGFGASQQTGAGIAAGLSTCPLPGYVPFLGGGGLAASAGRDDIWIAWYMTGLTDWLQFMRATLSGLGWTAQRLMVLHPGYGVRANQTASSGGYQQSVAAGENATIVMASYQNSPNMWPWCTWIDGADGYSPPTVDSDFAAWKKLYSTALRYGKANYVRGENTSNASGGAVMDMVFANALATGEPSSGYPQDVDAGTWQGYKGLMWLDYASLDAGAPGVATMSDYRDRIATG
jgi:hypothetical protein